MRPLRLVIDGFGPYATRQSLDFAELRGADFFLIHGPTGSGKTTLLDAMAYALYGETSGAGRSAAQMRSQQADPAAETCVRFDFRIGENHFRIERRPEQEIAKKRGTGTTRRNPEATLWRANTPGVDPGPGDDGWTPLATKTQTVGTEVVRLLGFSCEQFRQVILIPQGRFREVLEADSKKREEILETLFGTQRFSQLAEQLKNRARRLEDQARTGAQEKTALLQAQDVETPDALRERHAAKRLSLGETETKLAGLKTRREQAALASDQARKAEAAFLETEAAQKNRETLTAREPAMIALRARLVLARRAAELRSARDLLTQARRLAEQAEGALQENRGTLPGLQAAVTRNVETRAAAARDLPREKELAEETLKLAALQPRLTEWDRTRQALLDAARLAEAAALEAAKQKTDALAAAAKIPEAEKRWSETSLARARLPALEIERKALAEQLTLLGRRAKLSATLAEAEKNHRLRKEEGAALRQRWDEARRQLDVEQARWDTGQAALLASGLAAEKPCPVCGSLHHPAPAHGDPDSLPSESLLKNAREDAEAANGRLETAREQFRKIDKELEALRAELRTLSEVTADAPALQARSAALAKQHTDLTALVAATPENWLEATRQAADAARAKAELAETRRAETAATRDRLQAAHDALGRDLPEALRPPGALTARLQTLGKEATALETVRLAAEKNLQLATEALKAAQAREEELAKAQLVHRAAAAQREQDWLRALQAAQFADEAAWLAACLDPAAAMEQERSLEQFTGALAAASDRLARAREILAVAAPAGRPDLAAILAADRQADEAHQLALAERSRLGTETERFAAALTRLEAMDKAFGELQAAYTVAGKVADAVSGKNPLGLTLQRFVLTAFLDDTLVAASARLVKMSRGRYRLERRRERTDLRRASGLDLDVFDEYTGLARSVNTLSGGESFLASLALALGLADVVQSYSGGLRMDALFIDEGFGTLDPEALDEALKVLIDLRENGRLVGIISHVPELKERIDVRLEVSTTRAGSSARFVSA